MYKLTGFTKAMKGIFLFVYIHIYIFTDDEYVPLIYIL